jgi:hypothetical protein
VVTVKEPPLLLIGRIAVENDQPPDAFIRLHKQVDQKILDGRRIVADVVLARRLQLAQLQLV